MPIIPEWLKAADPSANYLHGLQIGSNAASENARIAASERQNAMEAAARADQIKRNALLEQTRLQTQKAYHDQQLELRKQRLGQFQEQENFRAQQAAQKFADQQGFANDLRSGMDARTAMSRHPTLATPSMAMSGERDAQRTRDLAESAAMRKRGLDLQERGLDLRESQAKTPEVTARYNLPPAKLGQPSPGSMSGPLPILQQRFGTNLPPAMRPPPGTAQPSSAGGTAVTEPRTQDEFDALPSGVRYRNPKDGKVYIKRK